MRHIPRAPHRWSVTPKQAIALQERLRERVRIELPKRIRRIVGVDCAFTHDHRCICAAVVWDLSERRAVEVRTGLRPCRFPYVPGLLSFREVPAVLSVLRRIESPFEAVMCDGQGLAHPRRFGLASHLGVILDMTSIGCAKSRLVGTHAEPEPPRGAWTALMDGDDEVGRVLRTRDATRPIYVSIGHRATLDAAVQLALACSTGKRIPEPTRLADREVARVKRAQAHASRSRARDGTSKAIRR